MAESSSGATKGRGPLGSLNLGPLALAFFCVGANGLASIAGDTLFVSVFSLGELSRFVALSAIVRVAASFGYAAIADGLLGSDPSPRRAARLDAVFVGLTGLGFLVSAIAAATEARAAIYAVCLAQVILPPILPLIAFNTTASALRTRDAKRILPLVAAAATVGSIAVGAAASLLAKTAGVPSILGLGSLFAVASGVLLLRIGGGEEEAVSAQRSIPSTKPVGVTGLATLRETIADIQRIAAVRVVVAFAFFGAMATSFADYAFKAALKQSYGQADVAAALGVFSLISNAVVLALQLGITGPLVARLGVGRTLAVFPSILGFATTAAFALPALIGTGLARLAEVVVRYGVGNSVADVLIVPLSRAVRTRAKVMVKGAASPLGALLAGGALALFGEAGPPRVWQLGLLGFACVALLWSVRRAPRAYADALASALARGRGAFEISPEAAVVFRSAVKQQLEQGVAKNQLEEVRRTLELMTDRIFAMEDTAPALAAQDAGTRKAAVTIAARLATPEQIPRLFELAAPDPDPEVELTILRSARERGALASDARIERAIQLGSDPGASDATISLWAEGLLQDAQRGTASGVQNRVDRSLKQLRKAIRDTTGPRQEAALLAVGEIGDRRAEREVRQAMTSSDPRVFRAAAKSAIQIDAGGTVASLVARLVAGPHPAICVQALALAGPRAVRELIQALPVTAGEGAIAPTAVAEGRSVSGTVRAARALARIGGSATREVLPLFGELGHRARTSVAHAFSLHARTVTADERRLLEDAVGKLVGYGQMLVAHRHYTSPTGPVSLRGTERRPLLPIELTRRIEDTIGAIFDLACALGDRRALQRARLAILLQGPAGSGRDNALELVETVLPAPVGVEAAAFMAIASGPDEIEMAPRPTRALDGWLEKCRKYDARELPLTDPMLGILDKVLVLRDVPLFRGLSGEELYPVAEIAAVESLEASAEIVRQGDPSDDLYVVLEGELCVVKDGEVVGALGPSKTFGELGVLDGEPRAATVRSVSACRLLRIPRTELEALLDESPELAKGIIRTLLGYVRSGSGARLSAPSSKG